MTINDKYDLYEKLLREWSGKMNLVAKSTLAEIRSRHISDSAQLADYIPQDKTVLDLGSGAGFPAAVLAILGYKVIAIESVGKKCRFLEAVKGELDLKNLEIINDRVENCLPRLGGEWPRSGRGGAFNKNCVITARGFAPLIRILDMTRKLDCDYVLLKGRTAPDEIALARGKYGFAANLYPSATGDGFIVKLTTK